MLAIIAPIIAGGPGIAIVVTPQTFGFTAN